MTFSCSTVTESSDDPVLTADAVDTVVYVVRFPWRYFCVAETHGVVAGSCLVDLLQYCAGWLSCVTVHCIAPCA